MRQPLARNPLYEIDSHGCLFSARTGQQLKPQTSAQGYRRIQLYSQGRVEYVAVHRLVAETFIANPNHLPIVNHKDGNKGNNDVNNLEWVTQSKNVKHAIACGFCGEAKVRDAIPVEVYDRRGRLLGSFVSAAAAEKATGIRRTHISESCRNGTPVRGLCWRQSLGGGDSV